jgi:SGNH domain-containing protein
VGPYFDGYNAMLDRLSGRYPDRVRTIDLTDAVCPANDCRPRVDGIILRYDTLHSSTGGARWLVPHLERKLTAAGVKLDV